MTYTTHLNGDVGDVVYFFNHIRPFSGREGDQDLFKYVIDYHRDRSLHPRAELFQLVVVKNYLHLLSGNLT